MLGFSSERCSAGVGPFTCVNMVSPTSTAMGMHYGCIALMTWIQIKWILFLSILSTVIVPFQCKFEQVNVLLQMMKIWHG